jgi:hypothetical protein
MLLALAPQTQEGGLLRSKEIVNPPERSLNTLGSKLGNGW